MPGLRKLKLQMHNYYGDDRSILLARAWSNFPTLEELYFHNCAALLGDTAFIGENGELPVLQLTSEIKFPL